MNKNLKVLLLCMSLLTAGRADAIDTLYPLITYKCDTSEDLILVTNSLLKSDEGASFSYSAEEGTYNPWKMVEIARNGDSTRIINSNRIENSCKLSSGEYTVILEPQIFSHDLGGRCGASISGAMTVMLGDTEIMERTAFEDYCHGNAPIISKVKVLGKSREYKIKRIPKYKFY